MSGSESIKMSGSDIDSEYERDPPKEDPEYERKKREIFHQVKEDLSKNPLALALGYDPDLDPSDEEGAKSIMEKGNMSRLEWMSKKKENYCPPEEEERRLKYDNSPMMLFGQVEPYPGNLGQRHHFLPLVFSTILPCPFSLFRVITISARAKEVSDFNSRLRVLILNSKFKLKYVCDIGFRFLTMVFNKEEENELDDTIITKPCINEYRFSILVGPREFYHIMDSEVVETDFDLPGIPLVFPGEYLEVRGTLEFVSQFHIRTVHPYIWPPQQDRHSKAIFDNYFHYSIGLHVKPGHCFIITFKPFDVKGGVGIQLKAGPYRQTPLSLFGYFDSEKAVEIQATNDSFEFVHSEKGRKFPFKFDKENRVAILMCDDEFKIAINGKYYHTYPYHHSNLPGDITDIKINSDKGTRILCSSVHNSFIEDYKKGEKEVERFSKLCTEFSHKFYSDHYGGRM